MAQLDARQTGDQEAASLTPLGQHHSFVEMIMNIFYGHSLPSADSRRAVVNLWRKNVYNTV